MKKFNNFDKSKQCNAKKCSSFGPSCGKIQISKVKNKNLGKINDLFEGFRTKKKPTITCKCEKKDNKYGSNNSGTTCLREAFNRYCYCSMYRK